MIFSSYEKRSVAWNMQKMCLRPGLCLGRQWGSSRRSPRPRSRLGRRHPQSPTHSAPSWPQLRASGALICPLTHNFWLYATVNSRQDKQANKQSDQQNEYITLQECSGGEKACVTNNTIQRTVKRSSAIAEIPERDRYSYTPTEGFSRDDLRNIFHWGLRMAKVHSGKEILPKVSIPWVGRTKFHERHRQT